MQSVNNGTQVNTVYADIKTTFDNINLNNLINKLRKFVINETMLSWFNYHLSGRIQNVKVGISLSFFFVVSFSVLQWGHLSLLLFILFMNDISRSSRYSKLILFADDLKTQTIYFYIVNP